MPTYRVRNGEVLSHAGQVLEAGVTLELPRPVAEDPSVRGAIEEVDATGNLVTPPPADDLARFRTHERVSMLRDRLSEAQARVTQIQGQLAAEEQQLADQVTAAAAAAAASTQPEAPPPASATAKRPGTKDATSAAPATDSPAS